jgi:hypothetical protein
MLARIIRKMIDFHFYNLTLTCNDFPFQDHHNNFLNSNLFFSFISQTQKKREQTQAHKTRRRTHNEAKKKQFLLSINKNIN